MPIHDGKAVLRDSAGQLYKVPTAEAEQTKRAKGWQDASPAEVQARANVLSDRAKYGDVGSQAHAALEKGVRTATFGLLNPEMGAEERARAETLERESPVTAFAAQAAGTLAPAFVTGGLAGAAGAGRLGVGVAEGVAAGAADESESAAIAQRPVSVGNVMLFGLGGELAGRAVPALLRRGLRGLAPGTDAVARVAGEAAEDVTKVSEQRALTKAAEEAAALPEGPARQAAMAANPEAQVERASAELESALADGSKAADELDKAVDEIPEEMVAAPSPAQTQWATDTAKAIRAKLSPVAQAAVDRSRARQTQSGSVTIGDVATGADELGEDFAGAEFDYRGAERQALRTKDTVPVEMHTNQPVVEYDETMSPGRLARSKEAKRLQAFDQETQLAPWERKLEEKLAAHESSLEKTASLRKQLDELDKEVNRHGIERIEGATPAARKAAERAEKMARRNYEKLEQKVLTLEEMSGTEGAIDDVLVSKDASGVELPDDVYSPAEVARAYLKRRRGQSGNVSAGANAADVLSSPLGNVALTGAGAIAGGQVDGGEGMAAGGALGLAASALINKRARSAMMRFADDLLTHKPGAGMWKRARQGLKELESAGAPPEVTKQVRDGLKAKELWGQAADVESDLHRLKEKAAQAAKDLGGIDAQTLRAALGKEPALRGHGVRTAIETLEDVMNTASKWNLLPGNLGRLAKAVRVARRAMGDADSAAAGRVAPTTIKGEVVETMADMALGAMGVPPVAGLAAKLVMGRIDEGAKQAIKGAARRAVAPFVDDGFATVRSVAATSALSRFTGEYSSPVESFEAKKKMLEQVRISPTALPLALAESMGTLPSEDPKLFGQIAARVASQFAYVQSNLPVSIGVSLIYPKGIAPSKAALSDFATLWNSTFNPETVLEDFGKGEASPAQMRVLRDVHPDTYQSLMQETIFATANNFGEVPTQRKKQLDILFGTDGVAGPCFSWRAADYIGEAEAVAMQRPSPGSGGPQLDPKQAGATPLGLNAIRSGVTNRGA